MEFPAQSRSLWYSFRFATRTRSLCKLFWAARSGWEKHLADDTNNATDSLVFALVRVTAKKKKNMKRRNNATTSASDNRLQWCFSSATHRFLKLCERQSGMRASAKKNVILIRCNLNEQFLWQAMTMLREQWRSSVNQVTSKMKWRQCFECMKCMHLKAYDEPHCIADAHN